MLFKVLKLIVIGVLVISLATFVRAEINKFWNDKLVKEAIDFKVPATDLAPFKAAPKTVAAPGPCSSNSLDQLVLVSISQRHLWACQTSNVVYNSPVITGMEFLPADLTPTGTYHIYSKQTNVHLIGQDSTGSWNDFVYYWMPFLENQYGVYGFHDATWRPSNAFGNVSQYSSNASHGCVECPLATSAWLYSWTNVGTTVTIES
jgi:lipoprotein-anchoring transpeptidase ErfK/SrfK